MPIPPQAKGRVERVNRTLQDRLIKALRREGISNIAEANRYRIIKGSSSASKTKVGCSSKQMA
jgi:hypothetical protein